MIDFPYLSELIEKTDAKILMLVVDGLGGTPDPEFGRSELEAARVPNLDHLAGQSAVGLTIPVAPGISPGAGPGHLALFGYDPLKYVVGRGAFEALGAGLDPKAGDVVARGNLATLDEDGLVQDRRAGRIGEEEAAPLFDKLRKIKLTGVQTEIASTGGHRFVLRMRGPGLSPDVTDTDPGRAGLAPLAAQATGKAGAKTAKAVADFVKKAQTALKGSPANTVLLRGWSGPVELPSFSEAYCLNPAAIARYPMYRGVAQALGLKLLPAGKDFSEDLATLKAHWDEHDFFYMHHKEPDEAGVDGDFRAKRHQVEVLDEHIHDIIQLKPDVFIVAGDHASPSAMQAHSWHPVPFLLHSQWTVGDGVHRFNEHDLRTGSLGQFEAKHAMMLALAHAGKLKRFGA